MSELVANDVAPEAPPAFYFEQRLFDVSPVGTFLTSLAIFLLLFGSFEAVAYFNNYSVATQLSFSPEEGAWPAGILSLLAAIALGMQRYVRKKDIEDWPALARLMPCDPREMWVDTPNARMRIRRAGIIGAALGLLMSYLAVPNYVLHTHLPVYAWFAFIMTVLGAMFGRGIAMTRIAAHNFAARVDRHLKIDLLRVDQLSIIGRSAARAALIWLSVAAVVCLFFVSGHAPSLVIGTIVLSAGMSFWVFFRSLERVHRHVKAAKRAELDRLRHAIAKASAEASHDHAAATRLHGLLAYETRIEHVHEWPFDQFTLLRVGAYVLIPALPALGQVAFKLLSERVTL